MKRANRKYLPRAWQKPHLPTVPQSLRFPPRRRACQSSVGAVRFSLAGLTRERVHALGGDSPRAPNLEPPEFAACQSAFDNVFRRPEPLGSLRQAEWRSIFL